MNVLCSWKHENNHDIARVTFGNLNAVFMWNTEAVAGLQKNV